MILETDFGGQDASVVLNPTYKPSDDANMPWPPPDGETIEPKILAWWKALPDDWRNKLEQRHRTYRAQDQDFFCSDASLITYSYRVSRPPPN